MGKSLPFLSPQESGMDASQLRTIEQQVGEEAVNGDVPSPQASQTMASSK